MGTHSRADAADRATVAARQAGPVANASVRSNHTYSSNCAGSDVW